MTIETYSHAAAQSQPTQGRHVMTQGRATPFHRKVAAALVLTASSMLLASCGNSELTTGSIPDDYRPRHPIVLADGETTLDLPVAAGDVRLTIGMKDTVRGFAQR